MRLFLSDTKGWNDEIQDFQEMAGSDWDNPGSSRHALHRVSRVCGYSGQRHITIAVIRPSVCAHVCLIRQQGKESICQAYIKACQHRMEIVGRLYFKEYYFLTGTFRIDKPMRFRLASTLMMTASMMSPTWMTSVG